MLLVEIRNHIKIKKSQTLVQMAKQFDVATDVLQDMLQLLIHKGQVKVCKKTPICGTKCGKCSLVDTEVYEWVG